MRQILRDLRWRLHPSWLTVFAAVGIILGAIFWTVFGGSGAEGAEQFAKIQGQTITFSGAIIKNPDKETSAVKVFLSDIVVFGSNSESEKSEISADSKNDNAAAIADNSENTIALSGTVYVQIATSALGSVSLRRGDILTLSGQVSGGFGSYAASFYRPTVESVTKVSDPLLDFRDYFAANLHDYLPDEEAALGMGYLLGDRSEISDELIEMLRIVGLTHIIVASGAHLGALVGVAKKIFGKISRFAGTLAAILLVFIFIGITGISASMLRAGLVTILTLVCGYFGRKFQAWRLLLIVMALTLLYNTAYLTDLGWLLSFASFGGILILAPIMQNFFYGDRTPGFFGATLISSLAATLMCAPILFYYYGTLSLISPLANLLILPTVSLVMGLTFLLGTAAIVTQGISLLVWLPSLIAWVDRILLDYQMTIVEFLSQQTQFLVRIDAENPLVFLLFLPAIIIVVYGGITHWRRMRCDIIKTAMIGEARA